MEENKYLEEHLKEINKQEEVKFQKDIVEYSNLQPQLSELEEKELENHFSGMSEEEILKEFQKMFTVKRKPITRKFPKIGRNEPCPCGSGKKFKKCCKNDFETYLEKRSEDIGDI